MNEPKGVVLRSRRIPKEVVKRIEGVLKFFPELSGFYVYYTSTHFGKYVGGWKIAINPKLRGRFFNYVVAHELTHLIQYNQERVREKGRRTKYSFLYEQKIPKGELQCDIWCYARDERLVSISPYLARKIGVSERRKFEERSEEICNLAREAIELRKKKRTYIAWFTKELKILLD